MINFGGKQFPPMPKPEDFGITEDWEAAGRVAQGTIFPSVFAGGKAKVDAYRSALEAWKLAVREIGGA
jgi:hypothetical protein